MGKNLKTLLEISSLPICVNKANLKIIAIKNFCTGQNAITRLLSAS